MTYISAVHLLAGPVELQRGDLPSVWVGLPLAAEPRPDLAEAEANHQEAHSPRLGQQDPGGCELSSKLLRDSCNASL